MNTVSNCLLIGAGGMLGTIGRYLLGLLPIKMQNGFPVTTLFVNLLGAFCIGFIIALSEKSGNANPQLVQFLRIGVCGGFTTFSTFSLEAVQLLQNGKWGTSLSYMILSVVLCVASVAAAQTIVN